MLPVPFDPKTNQPEQQLNNLGIEKITHYAAPVYFPSLFEKETGLPVQRQGERISHYFKRYIHFVRKNIQIFEKYEKPKEAQAAFCLIGIENNWIIHQVLIQIGEPKSLSHLFRVITDLYPYLQLYRDLRVQWQIKQTESRRGVSFPFIFPWQRFESGDGWLEFTLLNRVVWLRRNGFHADDFAAVFRRKYKVASLDSF